MTNLDWNKYRLEVAKEALAAMISAGTTCFSHVGKVESKCAVYPDPDEICSMAVLYADVLIKELKSENDE